MAAPAGAGEQRATVQLPVSVGIVGPDVLVGTAMTAVEVDGRRMRVEGPLALIAGDVVALAADLPVLPATPAGQRLPAVLAIAVVTGRAVAVDATTWRTPLEIQQIDARDADRLAHAAARSASALGRGR
jgi:hypothetical protein